MLSTICPIAVLSLLLAPTLAFVSWETSCQSNFQSTVLTDVVAFAKTAYNALNNTDHLDSWAHYSSDTMYDLLFDANHENNTARRNGIMREFAKLSNIEISPNYTVVVYCNDITPYGPGGCAPRINGNSKFWPGGFHIALLNPDDSKPRTIVMCLDNHPDLSLTARKADWLEGEKLTNRVWSYVLGHEMLHALGDGMLSTHEKYGFDAAKSVRSTNGNKNPENLILFATAMYEDKFMWDTGKAVSKAKAYKKLAQENAGTVAKYGLNAPKQAAILIGKRYM